MGPMFNERKDFAVNILVFFLKETVSTSEHMIEYFTTQGIQLVKNILPLKSTEIKNVFVEENTVATLVQLGRCHLRTNLKKIPVFSTLPDSQRL